MRDLVRPCAVALALALVTTTWTARAQPSAADAEYQASIRNALSEFDSGNFAEARALFRRAHELQPSARTLRGIGMTSFELREYVDAIRSLSASITDARRPLEAPQRAQVQGLLDRAQTFVGRYQLDVDPADATLTVDGHAIVREPDGTLLLDLGRHSIVGRAQARQDATVAVEVRGGERDTLTVRLSAAAAPDANVNRELSAPRPSRAQRDEGGGGIPPAVWLVTSGVLATGSVLAGLLWWQDRSDEIAKCDVPGATCPNRDSLALERGVAAAVTIGLGVGAIVTLVVGIVSMSSSSGGSTGDGDRAALTCGPTLRGAICSGRF